MMTFVLQYGWSPLYKASDAGHHDIVKTLIKGGANVNQAANKVQCVGKLHVAFSVIVIYMNTPTYCVCVSIACVLIHAVVTRFTIMLLNT